MIDGIFAGLALGFGVTGAWHLARGRSGWAIFSFVLCMACGAVVLLP